MFSIHCVTPPCSTCLDTVMPPKVTDPVVNGTRVTILWDHTNKGPCFNNLTFFYNITWYPVGISHARDVQGIVTGPDAAQLTIITLMYDTDYQVKIVGFTLSDPAVYSEEATVNFTTKGVYVHIICRNHKIPFMYI